MRLEAFTDELVKTAAAPMRKVAGIFAPRPDRLVERLVATGALSSGALYGASKAKSLVSGNPYDAPEGTVLGALGKGAVGGVLAGLALKAMARLHRGRRP